MRRDARSSPMRCRRKPGKRRRGDRREDRREDHRKDSEADRKRNKTGRQRTGPGPCPFCMFPFPGSCLLCTIHHISCLHFSGATFFTDRPIFSTLGPFSFLYLSFCSPTLRFLRVDVHFFSAPVGKNPPVQKNPPAASDRFSGPGGPQPRLPGVFGVLPSLQAPFFPPLRPYADKAELKNVLVRIVSKVQRKPGPPVV